jgi:urease accessory protein
VLGFDHLLAMVAVGLWGAVLGRPLIAALPVIFPAFMVVGGLLGIAGAPMAPVEIGIALSVLLLGAAIAARFVAPVWLACLLVGVFGLFHGYAHGQELPVSADPTAYGLGFVLATGALHGGGHRPGLAGPQTRGTAGLASGGRSDRARGRVLPLPSRGRVSGGVLAASVLCAAIGLALAFSASTRALSWGLPPPPLRRWAAPSPEPGPELRTWIESAGWVLVLVSALCVHLPWRLGPRRGGGARP